MFDNEGGTETKSFHSTLLQLLGTSELADKYLASEDTCVKLSLLWKAPLIQQMLKNQQEHLFSKSEGDSKRFREYGNKHFQKGLWEQAAHSFSSAVAFAPQNEKSQGRDLSLALANRSAALLHMDRIEDSLEDIQLALEAGYPQDLRYKLYERQIQCYMKLASQDKAETAFEHLQTSLSLSKLDEDKRTKVSSSAREVIKKGCPDTVYKVDAPWLDVPSLVSRHPQLPAFSNVVEVRSDTTRGRYCIANRDIHPGELILIEDPVVSYLDTTYNETHCHNCFLNIPHRQVPCNKCTVVRFCNKACRTKAQDTFHKHECGKQDIFDSTLGKMMQNGQSKADGTKRYHHLSFRTITQKSLQWFLDNKKTISRFRYDLTDTSNGYEGLAGLVSHSERMTTNRVFMFLLSSMFHVRSLQLSAYFGAVKHKVNDTLTENELFIGELLFTYLIKLQFNTHGINEGLADNPEELNNGLRIKAPTYENRVRSIGNGLYTTLALMNHSCENNICKYFVGSTVVVLASQMIRRGEEITECYYPSAKVIERPERRKWLSNGYWFDCGCLACVNNYPTMLQLQATPSAYRCEDEECVGILTAQKCPLCSKEIDRTAKDSQVKALWQELKVEQERLHTKASYAQLQQVGDSIKEKYIRLTKQIAPPSKILYHSEIIYWRYVRLVHGNRQY